MVQSFVLAHCLSPVCTFCAIVTLLVYSYIATASVPCIWVYMILMCTDERYHGHLWRLSGREALWWVRKRRIYAPSWIFHRLCFIEGIAPKSTKESGVCHQISSGVFLCIFLCHRKVCLHTKDLVLLICSK